MAGSAKLNANGADTTANAGERRWDYSTAQTAWDVLCHDRAAGVFFAAWKESKCMFFCHHLKFECDPDERVQTIKVKYGRLMSSTYDLPKSAVPVTTDGLSFRFFLNSEGCDSGDNEDCDLPWEPYDEVRNSTKTAHITKRFLHYDARKPGARALSIEKNVYEAWFHKSAIQKLGAGLPLPEELKYAGASGTGCGVGVSECSKPVDGPEPVPETTIVDVTTRYVTELKGLHMIDVLVPNPEHHLDFLVEESVDTTGYVSLFKNRNWAKSYKTKVFEFELK
jgi:hypothetical protein